MPCKGGRAARSSLGAALWLRGEAWVPGRKDKGARAGVQEVVPRIRGGDKERR